MTANDESWRGERIVSETIITVYPDETPDQRKAREKLHKPYPSFQFIAVKVETINGREGG